MAPEYQTTKAGAKALYALDNLWDGLGALTVVYPQIKYLFGKVTMYPQYNHECRDMILGFMHKHFRILTPCHTIDPLPTAADSIEIQSRFTGLTIKRISAFSIISSANMI